MIGRVEGDLELSRGFSGDSLLERYMDAILDLTCWYWSALGGVISFLAGEVFLGRIWIELNFWGNDWVSCFLGVLSIPVAWLGDFLIVSIWEVSCGVTALDGDWNLSSGGLEGRTCLIGLVLGLLR